MQNTSLYELIERLYETSDSTSDDDGRFDEFHLNGRMMFSQIMGIELTALMNSEDYLIPETDVLAISSKMMDGYNLFAYIEKIENCILLTAAVLSIELEAHIKDVQCLNNHMKLEQFSEIAEAEINRFKDTLLIAAKSLKKVTIPE